MFQISESKEQEDLYKIKILRELLEDQENYLEMTRAYGTGYRRLGNKLVLSEDIFSLAFAVSVKDTILVKHFDVVNGDFWDKDEQEEKDRILDALNVDDTLINDNSDTPVPSDNI